jgi:hypothetical protein
MKRTFKTQFFKVIVCTVAIASAIVPAVSAQTEDPLAGGVVNAIVQNATDQMIEMMTGMGQQVISQIEQSPCENFSSSMPENHLTESQSAFKEQIASQFINIFQRLLRDAPSSPEFFRQTSSLMFNKLSECALKKPRY